MDLDYCEEVNFLRGELCMKWVQIAQEFNVTIRQFECWRVRVNYIDPLERINDAMLDCVVEDFLDGHVNRGSRFVSGFLRSEGLLVTREQLRQSTVRVNPEGRHEYFTFILYLFL